MNKVSAKLKGGLCNYMFQIACAHSYAIKNNKESIFSTNDSIVRHKHVDDYKNNVLKNVNFLDSHDFNSFFKYNEQHFHFKEILNVDGDIYLDGDFQSEKYFKENENEIKKLFSYPEEIKNSMSEKWKFILKENTCSIHIRRADYLNYQDAYVILDLNYYLSAMKQLQEGCTFLIFSDDLQWCKENFFEIKQKIIFIENQLDYEDLLLMSLCKNNIIANSSFSWWGAWLNNNENKTVVAPKRWFNSALSSFNTNDLYCDNWIKL
jgi:hypothetical protein